MNSSPSRSVPDAATLARVHGIANIAGGLWPLLHMRSFTALLGEKDDEWLVRAVAGLLVANGWTQLRAAWTPEGPRHARRVGMGTAATLLLIDVVYVARRRIPRTYLLDAAMETAVLLAWSLARMPDTAPVRSSGPAVGPPQRAADPAGAGVVITAELVRELVSSPLPDATLVVAAGEARVVAGGGEHPEGALVVVARADLPELAGDIRLDRPEPADLAALAERLTSAIVHLGG